jgi:ATP-dependent Clp protease adapter protein ClpS
MPEVIDKPDIRDLQIEGVDSGDTKEPFAVEAFNNDTTTFGEVIKVLKTVCGYEHSVAEAFAKTIDRDGHVICFTSVSKQKCEFLIKAFANVLVRAELLEGDK